MGLLPHPCMQKSDKARKMALPGLMMQRHLIFSS